MDVQLYSRQRGSGEALLLLHGNGENGSYFRHQMDFFSRSYRVIAIDTRGHGRSPRGSAPFTLDQFADDLRAFMDEAALDSADLLGFSDGGNIALLFALRYPRRVRRLILNGANLNPKGVKPSVQLPITASYHLARMFAGRSQKAAKRAELLGLMVNEPAIDPGALRAVRAPTLVIAGTRDMIRPDHTRLIAQSIPGAQLVFIGGDHFIAAKEPEAFNLTVANFLDRHPLPSGQ